LNGITIYDRIRAITQKGIVFPACVYVGTHIASPGIITQKGGEGKILFGPDPNYPDFSPASILHLFDTLHIHYEWNTDPKIAIWTKYLFIAGYGLVCAARSKTLGQVYEDPILKNDVSTIMHEIVSLAEAQAIFLPHNVIALSLRKATQFPYDTKTSFHRDIESKGHRNEMDIFGKAILELGQKYSCSTAKTEEYVTRLL
jgi:2-dehydropantoate 2-reductase